MALVVRICLQLALIGALVWGAYRLAMKGLVFLRALTRPVRRVVRGALDPIERAAANHVADSLEEAGLRGAASRTRKLPDAAASVESAIGQHLDRHTSPKE